MWNLYKKDKFLEPLCFSNGKSQKDVVKEVLDAVKEGNKIIFIHGVCGTGKCLDRDSLIFCKPLEENNFSYYKISEIVGKEGEIICLNKKGNFVNSKFKNVRETGIKKMFKLKTRTGREIIASENHPFLTITKEGLVWFPLKELNEKSYICLPHKLDLQETSKLKDEEIKILAHLIAEGKLGDKTGSPKYYQCLEQNPLVRKDYISSVKNLFPEAEIKEIGKYEISVLFRDMNTTKGTTNKLRLFIKKFGLDGKKSGEKFVPKEIFNLKKEKIALFLKILFSCDGSIYRRQKQDVIEYSSISKRLVEDVSFLLKRFGIGHTITPKKFRENKNYSWRIVISSHKDLRNYILEIGFIGRKQKIAEEADKELSLHKFTNIDKIPRITREYIKSLGYNYAQLDRFLNYEEIEKLRKTKGFKKIRADKKINTPFVFNQQKIDFLREHIKIINRHVKDSTLSFICNPQIIWDKIKSIEFIKEDKAYDLEVPEYHNFIANGIVVHNSAVALNIARKLGKASIVVPGKNLQNQYKKDYEGDTYLKKDNGEKLKISVITGRKNHKCKFLEDNSHFQFKEKREVNSKLHDIFGGWRKNNLRREVEKSADNSQIPCKIEIKEKNWNKIKKYLEENKDVNIKNFQEIKDVKRVSVAGVCPYWCPVVPEKYELGGTSFINAIKRSYTGLNGTKFIFYQRRPGCKFYEQFNSYIDSDVIVFNSLKYKLESLLNRKPETEVEIIDECDEFLDSFSNQRTLNLDRLQNSMINIFSTSEGGEKVLQEIFAIIKHLKKDARIADSIQSEAIIPLKETGIYDLFLLLIKNPEILKESEIDDESYLFDVEETARMFEGFFNESFVSFTRKEDNLIASIVTTNLAKKFKEMVEKNKVVVLMSGTLHSLEVLREVFGLENFKIVDAETSSQGKIEVVRTGKEMDCRYSNFSAGRFKRENYLSALDKCLEVAKKPVLVHINSFLDLPSEREIEEFDTKNLMSREELKKMQEEDKVGNLIENFKRGEVDVLFSTRASRGIDFPGEECNSIVFTKYPNPNVKDAFWKILNKTNPQHYWNFYKDKARRELWQKIYRGLRFKNDHVYVLSPDTRVLEAFEQ
jgi:intein/homing endonuclease